MVGSAHGIRSITSGSFRDGVSGGSARRGLRVVVWVGGDVVIEIMFNKGIKFDDVLINGMTVKDYVDKINKEKFILEKKLEAMTESRDDWRKMCLEKEDQ